MIRLQGKNLECHFFELLCGIGKVGVNGLQKLGRRTLGLDFLLVRDVKVP